MEAQGEAGVEGVKILFLHNQNGYNSLAGRLGPQVPVDQLKSLGRFTRENGICETDFGEDAPQGVGLGVHTVLIRTSQKTVKP